MFSTDKKVDLADLREAIAEDAKQAEEARLEAERKAAREAEFKAAVATRNAAVEDLLEWVKVALLDYKGAHSVHHDTETGKLLIDGVDVTYRFGFDNEYTPTGRFSSKPTGRVRMWVDVPSMRYNRHSGHSFPSTSKQSFPPRKDGTHNYKTIAKHLVDYAMREVVQRKRANTQKANEQAAQRVRDLTGVNDYYGGMTVKASADASKPCFVKLEWQGAVTELQAQAIHAALRKCGVIKDKK
jgi:hypothetical protein